MKRLDLWLPTYLLSTPARALRRWSRGGQLTHILFLVCDHFEPRHGITHEDQPVERLARWREGYAQLQQRCRAAFGNAPVHTWFYPPHHGLEHLPWLGDVVFDGLGEVELHYHHDGDTAESLRADLKAALAQFNRWGLLLESGANPRTSFGFIHGDWALDNSGHGHFCGVNDELSLLQSLGCWADFTMPSANDCQTRKINAVYYAKGDPARSKSHDWGPDAEVGKVNQQGLFLMQGPLAMNWRAPGYPRIENGSLTTPNWGRPDRVSRWLDCHVHVKGRPEWLFVKLHTHGAIERDFDALFGERAFDMYRLLNEQYNDGKRYRLHCVTARQAYNIAKAAEHGKEGDPAQWVDYVLPPQPRSLYALDAPHDLKHCTAEHIRIQEIGAASVTRFRTRLPGVAEIRGALKAVDIDASRGSLLIETHAPGVEVQLRTTPPFEAVQIRGAKPLGRVSGSDPALRFAVDAGGIMECRLEPADSVAPARLSNSV